MEADRHLSQKLALSADDLSAAKIARAGRHDPHRLQFHAPDAMDVRDATTPRLAERASRAVLRLLDSVAGALPRKRRATLDTLKQLFDEDWYVATYPDILTAYRSGWKHFI